MLLNGPKLLRFVGQATAPVTVECPSCYLVTTRPSWWHPLQTTGLSIVCVCGSEYRVSRFDPEDLPEEPAVYCEVPLAPLTVYRMADMAGAVVRVRVA